MNLGNARIDLYRHRVWRLVRPGHEYVGIITSDATPIPAGPEHPQPWRAVVSQSETDDDGARIGLELQKWSMFETLEDAMQFLDAERVRIIGEGWREVPLDSREAPDGA